jgi:hypothetical protein
VQVAQRPAAPFEDRVAVGVGGGLLAFSFTALGLLVLLWARMDGFEVALFLVPILLAASWPTFVRQGRRERDARLVQLLLLALALKLLGSLLRYWVALHVYQGNADAFEYHKAGVDLAMRFRAGNFDTGLQSLSGTDFISFVTGIVYTITGPSIYAGSPSAACSTCTGRSPSPSPTATGAATPGCCSSCRRCCTGPPASARKRGCCSRSGWPRSARRGC